MKNEETGWVFVYGTLKIGEFLAEQFDAFRLKSYKATVKGKLYDIGFPTLKLKGKGVVHGELHLYKNIAEVLRLMDIIEGYHADDPDNSMYLRKDIKVTYVTKNKILGKISDVYPNRNSFVQKASIYEWKQKASIYEWNLSTDERQYIKSGIWEGQGGWKNEA